MKYTRYLVACAVLIIAACSDSHHAQQVSTDHSSLSPSQVAEKELLSLRESSNWALLGVGSPEDAKKAVLGKPLHVYFAKSDELGNYRGGDLSKILHGTDEVVFPVIVDGEGRILIEVSNRGGSWITIRDGYQDSAAALAAAEAVPTQEGVPTASILVKLPSMEERNVLLTGKVHTAAPGGNSDSIPVPDLNEITEIVQLNGKPLVSNKSGHPALDNSSAIIYFNKYELPLSKTSNKPGGAPSDPAQDFFKALAPEAKQVATNAKTGPG